MSIIKETYKKVTEKTATVRTQIVVAGGIVVAIVIAAAFLKAANDNYDKAKALDTLQTIPDVL